LLYKNAQLLKKMLVICSYYFLFGYFCSLRLSLFLVHHTTSRSTNHHLDRLNTSEPTAVYTNQPILNTIKSPLFEYVYMFSENKNVFHL